MRRRLTVLLAMAVMLAMMAFSGAAWAQTDGGGDPVNNPPPGNAPGNNGRGAENANPNASFGIATAIANSGSGGCDFAC